MDRVTVEIINSSGNALPAYETTVAGLPPSMVSPCLTRPARLMPITGVKSR